MDIPTCEFCQKPMRRIGKMPTTWYCYRCHVELDSDKYPVKIVSIDEPALCPYCGAGLSHIVHVDNRCHCEKCSGVFAIKEWLPATPATAQGGDQKGNSDV